MARHGVAHRRNRRWLSGFAAAAVLAGGATSAAAIATVLGAVSEVHEPQAEHIDQLELRRLVQDGQSHAAFESAFALGDELFEVQFNALDGVGANVGDGTRFTRVPRADLDGDGQWAAHFPKRATGPNGQACNQCHNTPFDDGAGSAVAGVHRDPGHSGDLGAFIQRDTPHVFGIGALQRLAEEMTEDLHGIRDAAQARACTTGKARSRRLTTKGVNFGWITAEPVSRNPCKVEFDTSRVRGVDGDLVVRPLQWKGSFTTVRAFNRDASHNELGMQPVETVGDGVDGDFDGVVDEMTVGDQTGLAIYLAAQPRPTTKVELASLGLIAPLSQAEQRAIRRGRRVFDDIRCSRCHRPQLRIEDPVFSEPSQNPHFRDAVFPAGQDPVERGVDPKHPITFDLTRDQPDNVVTDPAGMEFRLGAFAADRRGRAIVELYGDLRRHDMGERLAESIDETGSGAATYITKELWGVGSTAPYLHDGRATTLTEAILAHGGDAARSRRAFRRLRPGQQAALIAFLENLVLFKIEEEETEE